MIKLNKRAFWLPNFVADTVLDIDADALQRAGITHVVFDLDETLVRRQTNVLTPRYRRFIHGLQAAGFTVMLGTNSRRNVTDLSTSLGIVAVQPRGLSYKPLPSFYTRVMTVADASPQHIVMVGDHIINDIAGANLSGLTTVLIKRRHSKRSRLRQAYIYLAIKFSGTT